VSTSPSIAERIERVERRGRWYDRLGAGAATVCALHCALLPLAIIFLPALGLEFFASHAFEGFFLAFSTVFAVLSVAHSLRIHRRFFAWHLLLPGMGLLWLERFIPWIHDHPVAHAVGMTMAGGLVAAAHLVNLRRAHHAADTTCGHCPARAPGDGGATLSPLPNNDQH
jgi:hypothetical protein